MGKNSNIRFSDKYKLKWVFTISIWTFMLAVVFSIAAENTIKGLGVTLSFSALLIIIVFGIIFDIIGIAVTRAEEKPFHSMAAKKIDEGKIAIKLVRNADKVSNFCNDVVGDISGIISGAIGATLAIKLLSTYDLKSFTKISIFMTAITASLTVGGKALGKSYALINYERIVLSLARLIAFVENKLKVDFFKGNKNKSNK